MTAVHGPGQVGRPVTAAMLHRLGVVAVVFASAGPPVALLGWFAMLGGIAAGFAGWLGGSALAIAAVVIAAVGLALRGERRYFIAALAVPFAYVAVVTVAFVALKLSVSA